MCCNYNHRRKSWDKFELSMLLHKFQTLVQLHLLQTSTWNFSLGLFQHCIGLSGEQQHVFIGIAMLFSTSVVKHRYTVIHYIAFHRWTHLSLLLVCYEVGNLRSAKLKKQHDWPPWIGPNFFIAKRQKLTTNRQIVLVTWAQMS